MLCQICIKTTYFISFASFIDAAPPTLHHSSYISHLHTRTPFVSHYTLNTQYFCLLSHYAHSNFTFHLQHIHCSCIFCRVNFLTFYLLSQLTYFFCLTQTHNDCPTFTLHSYFNYVFRQIFKLRSSHFHSTLTLF